LAGLQARQRQIDPNDVQQVIQFASAVRALQLEIKGLQKLQAEEAKAATPARAPRAATPKTPKGPKVVTPKAEGVRKGQGVLKGVVPDQPDLIDNVAAMENRQGGIPPVEPVAGNVLPFEDLAARQKKAKGDRIDNIGIARRIQELGGLNPATFGGEVQNARKYPGLVRENGLSPDVLVRDLAAEGYPVDPENVDTLWEALDRAAAGQDVQPISRSRTGDLDAEYAAYQEQQARNEEVPTTSVRLPSGLIAEPRRPQPAETPRSTPSFRQQALDRINAAELPGNAKQRYRDWLEQGRLSDSDVLNDPDLAPAAQSTPAEQVQEVEMRRTGTDNAPVVEMPKRATPPQPIPEELSRVYGGKITPEQAEAIQRRAKNRASVEIGLGGKWGLRATATSSDLARKPCRMAKQFPRIWINGPRWCKWAETTTARAK
jgi:hypothetical protein